ncbi:hypothetical protein PQR63_14310 [Herbaspirillum rhizosphaerae]|uniref:Uncharacterized protein n=1 Tax=Herbaspirillum rhizosphaerae TaxID=346179 RepID=A0ABW8ZB87_9BURK
MSDRRITPVRPVEGVIATEATSFRKTYFEQLHYWRSMSEHYARQRKAKEATTTYKEELDKRTR